MGSDNWAFQPLTTRGIRKILIGIAVPRITRDFPMVDLQEATHEIKNNTNDPKIQTLTDGHYKLLQVIRIITKERERADRRATDKSIPTTTIQLDPSSDSNIPTQTEEAMNHTPYCNTGVKLAASTQGLDHRNQYDQGWDIPGDMGI